MHKVLAWGWHPLVGSPKPPWLDPLLLVSRRVSRRGDGIGVVDELADLGVNAAKVRKDLSHLGTYGTRGVGYDAAFPRFRSARRSASPTSGPWSCAAWATSDGRLPTTPVSPTVISPWWRPLIQIRTRSARSSMASRFTRPANSATSSAASASPSA